MQRAPQDCATMGELRAEIDRIDATLVALLAERAAYIDRAAQIKIGVALPARIESRVEEVVANVLRHAEGTGLPAEMLERFWREMIEWSIAREEQVLGPDEE